MCLQPGYGVLPPIHTGASGTWGWGAGRFAEHNLSMLTWLGVITGHPLGSWLLECWQQGWKTPALVINSRGVTAWDSMANLELCPSWCRNMDTGACWLGELPAAWQGESVPWRHLMYSHLSLRKTELIPNWVCPCNPWFIPNFMDQELCVSSNNDLIQSQRGFCRIGCIG